MRQELLLRLNEERELAGAPLGVGLAIGPGHGLDPSGYRVVWVQSFGRRAGAVRLAP